MQNFVQQYISSRPDGLHMIVFDLIFLLKIGFNATPW